MGHNCLVIGLGVSVMVFAAFNNISVISWWRKTKKNTDLLLVTDVKNVKFLWCDKRDIILMWKTWNFSGVTNVTNVKFLCDVIIWYWRIWSDLIDVDTLTMRYTTIGYLLCNVNLFFSPCLLIFVEHFSTCFLIYYCSFLTDQKYIEEKKNIFLCILF